MSSESTRAEGRDDEPVTAGFTIHDYLSRPPGHLRLRRLPALLRLALSVVWRAARREFLLSCALQLLAAIGFGAQVLAVRNLVGDIAETDAVAYGSIVVLAAVTAGVALINIMLDVQQRIMGVKVAQHTTDQVIETATTVDLVTYESPAFHDALQRAQLSAQVRPLQLVAGVIGIGSTGLAIAGIGAALLVIQPVFFSLILLGFLPSWFATNRAHRLAYRFSIEQTERDRRRQYLFMVLTRKEEAQEVRAFGLGGFLGERHRALYEELITDTRVMLRRRLRISLAGQAASAIMLGLTIGFLVWLVTSDRITLAAAASAAGAMLLLNGRLTGLVGSVGSLYDGSLYLDDYATFVAAAPQLASRRGTRPAPEALERVTAEGVSFTYPSRAEPSLIDADLELRRGEVVALVGENGSGKTTFAKLLAGLYQPESGSITWDGVDLRDIDPSSAQSRVAVIFQDFVRWQLSAYANIALGDHEREHDAEAVSRAADAAGVHEVLNDLINGYETLLGPQFYGGSSLSGGEWQRVALARAFFRDAPLVILDEPTAALDAKAEAAMYARMGELFKGRGVLLISHRFGSVRTADRIYVLDKGRVVERGTHAELIALDGHYAELFRLQADRYID